MQLKIHWLSLTIWGTHRKALTLWDVWFADYLGALQATGHGGRGFKNLFSSLAEGKGERMSFDVLSYPCTFLEVGVDGILEHIPDEEE